MNIIVLISGYGSNLQAIIDAGIPITAVISNRPEAYGLIRARDNGIPAHVVDHKAFDSREAFDEKLQAAIDEYHPDLVVLAGFMRILTEGFVTYFLGKLINIHPALLPKYKGLYTTQRVLEAGDDTHGATIHYVTPELDAGPIISQVAFEVTTDDSEKTLSEKITDAEHKLYPQTIELIRSGQIKWQEDRVLFEGTPLAKTGIMLNL